MRVYRDLEMVEQLGSGLPRILQIYGQECFYFSESYTRMIFPAEEKMNRAIDGGLNVGANVGANVGVNVGVNEVLEIVKNRPGINTKEIHQQFDVTLRTIERWIKELRGNNKIEFRGASKTGGYYLKNSDD